MVPDNEIVVTKLENKCNFISNFFVLMHFTGQKKKSIGVIHSVFRFKSFWLFQELCKVTNETVCETIYETEYEKVCQTVYGRLCERHNKVWYGWK